MGDCNAPCASSAERLRANVASSAASLPQDADKSDYVDAQEFKSIFSDIGEKHSDDRLAEIDNIGGRGDSDGRLSSTEFCDFFIEYFADMSDKAFKEKIAEWDDLVARSFRKLLLRRVFARMDVDKSGGVSLQEFQALADEDVGADQSDVHFKWIQSADANADGQLTTDEWVPFVIQMEEETTDEEFEQKVADWLAILETKRRSTLVSRACPPWPPHREGALGSVQLVGGSSWLTSSQRA